MSGVSCHVLEMERRYWRAPLSHQHHNLCVSQLSTAWQGEYRGLLREIKEKKGRVAAVAGCQHWPCLSPSQSEGHLSQTDQLDTAPVQAPCLLGLSPPPRPLWALSCDPGHSLLQSWDLGHHRARGCSESPELHIQTHRPLLTARAADPC